VLCASSSGTWRHCCSTCLRGPLALPHTR
jgi:hypothetical protein